MRSRRLTATTTRKRLTSRRTACTHPRRRLPPGHLRLDHRRRRGLAREEWVRGPRGGRWRGSGRGDVLDSALAASDGYLDRLLAAAKAKGLQVDSDIFRFAELCSRARGGRRFDVTAERRSGVGTTARSPSRRGPIPPRTTSPRPQPRRMRGTGYVARRTPGSPPRSSDRVSWSRTTGRV